MTSATSKRKAAETLVARIALASMKSMLCSAANSRAWFGFGLGLGFGLGVGLGFGELARLLRVDDLGPLDVILVPYE